MAKITRQTKTGKRRSLKQKLSRPKKSPSQGDTGFYGKSPLGIVLYGPSGVGKTSFASYFPKSGFLIDQQEEGIKVLVEYGIVPKPLFIREFASFPRLIKLCCDLASDSEGINTLVIDSATGVEKLCFAHHCEENYNGDWSREGFYAYQQGPKSAAKTDWPEFLDALDTVRHNGINVVLLAHSQVKTYANPEGADYDRFIPYLDKETWVQTHRWAKAVLFYNYHVSVDRKGGIRNKAKDTEERFIYTQWSPAFDAKNQYGLPPAIEAGDSGEEAYNNFKDAFLESINQS